MRALVRTALVTVLALGVAACQSAPAATGPAPSESADPVVEALESAAYPVRPDAPISDTEDLESWGDMVGDARIASVGEATHSSREFVTTQHRMFRYLVEEKGFRTFAREISWTTGERLDDYVVHGIGDPGEILRQEFQTFYAVFDNREFLEFVEWLREYNTRVEPGDEVRFMGADVGFPGLNVFDEVDAYVHRRQPDLRPVFDRLRTELAPAPGQDLQQYMTERQSRPLAEREALATRAEEAAAMLHAAGPQPGSTPDEHAWAAQRATALAQVAREYAFDVTTPQGADGAFRHRDRSMDANIAWWERHTGHKIMVSSMNPHATYEPIDDAAVPEPLGGMLRERYGDDVVTTGLSFASGATNVEGEDGYHRVTAGPPSAGHNEYTLAALPHPGFVVDLRTVEEPARSWSAEPRPTFTIGGRLDPATESDSTDVALSRSYDLLLHVNEVTAADLRKQP